MNLDPASIIGFVGTGVVGVVGFLLRQALVRVGEDIRGLRVDVRAALDGQAKHDTRLTVLEKDVRELDGLFRELRGLIERRRK